MMTSSIESSTFLGIYRNLARKRPWAVVLGDVQKLGVGGCAGGFWERWKQLTILGGDIPVHYYHF